MNPAHLDRMALRFELKIRDKNFEDLQQAQRALRAALREEKEDKNKRPQPILDPKHEITEIATLFDELRELSTTTLFKEGNRQHEQAYSTICHLEKRVSYIQWREIEDENTKAMYESYVNLIEVFRQKYYSNRPPYIIENTQRDAAEEETNVSIFSQQDEDKMRRLQEEVKKLQLQKARATSKDVSYEQEIGDDSDDDVIESEVLSEEKIKELRDARDKFVKEQEEMYAEYNKNSDNEPKIIDRRHSSSEIGSKPSQQKFPIQANMNRLPNPQPQVSNSPNHQIQSFPNRIPNTYNGDINNSFTQDIPMNSTGRSYNSFRSSSLPMHKWNISFSGERNGEVLVFIKDVENMAKSQGTTTEGLRQGVSTLLKGKARDWYRVYGNDYGTWVAFVNCLKEVYLPAGFDHRVEDEIRVTKQREDETFQEFCVRIELVFMKLSYVMMESQKLDRIKHNMFRSYKSPEIVKIRTIGELREACRYMDSIEDRLQAGTQAQKPERTTNIRPPRIFEVEAREDMNQREENNEEEIPSSAESLCQQENELQLQIQELQAQSRQFRRNYPQRQNIANQICYNCQQPGHFASSCRRPQQQRVISCRGCGARGIMQQNCRNCQENSQQPAMNGNSNGNSAGNGQQTQ